jgi:tetratricopeptide (TPR) repeat protein
MAAQQMGTSTPRRTGPGPLVLAILLLAGATAAGWWIGSRQQSTAGAPSATAPLEREVSSLRRRLAQEQASPEEQQRLLELLVALNRQAEAIALLEPLADQQPDRWALRLMLAELRRDRGDRSGAERELRMILNRRSDQVEALQLMTLLQLEQGRGAEAEARVSGAYRKAVAPPVKPEALGLGLLLAELQQKRGLNSQAMATYRQLAVNFPEDQRPLLGLALLRHQLGDNSGALEALNLARQRSTDPRRTDPLLNQLAGSWGLAPLRTPAAPGLANGGHSPAGEGSQAGSKPSPRSPELPPQSPPVSGQPSGQGGNPAP